ncbi:nad dependent epimerase dehydratase family protein [Fusarium avenaceum]|nr:nad dependent epimerase dehydratase family protein [Fusarium avenaceum]
MEKSRILVLGASGYINKAAVRFSAVRHESQGDILQKHGVNTVLFSGLDDVNFVQRVAAQNDIAINTANTFHSSVAKAIIEGLAARQEETGYPTHLIQTSGSGSFADNHVSQRYIETRILSDKDDIYEYEKYREKIEPFPQRSTDVTVVEYGQQLGVRTYIVSSPIIYGLGSGFFNRRSMQIEALIRDARQDGYVSQVGDGKGEWDYVHIDDLVALYELLVVHILKGDDISFNAAGYYFSETGYVSWKEISQHIAQVGKELGLLKTDNVKELTLEEASEKLLKRGPDVAELGWGSRSRTRADRSREIGWQPSKMVDDFLANFKDLWETLE